MSDGLTYADAVRLLGGKDSKIVSALDKASEGILLGAAVTVPAMLGWLEARAEFSQLCRQLIRNFAEHRSGLSRYDRTERLQAAHGVVVVSSYFEALARADLPFRFADLKLTKAEQLALASDASPLSAVATTLADGLLRVIQAVMPERHLAYEDLLASLETEYYVRLSTALARFVRGLAIWDQLTDTERERFDANVEKLPKKARRQYEEFFGRLAADFPEVAFWATVRGHQATRAQVRGLSIALGELEKLLSRVSTGRPPDGWRASLARAYRDDLQRPIVESGEVPVGLRVPVLGEGYVPPPFRVHRLAFGENPSDESWWDQIAIRSDLEEFLTGYLTSPQATRAPLLVLGHPGSGKSVMTRILAARLPAADFLSLRVVLRDVSAVADVQDQVEQAIRAATGERIDWPELARSAGDALPVIMLDGFDELLQATGVSQSDYLTKVATFQRREAAQGRPTAVIVTSRTSVAHRARAPEESVALRLDPFDTERIRTWLAIWNKVNLEHFEHSGLMPLPPEAVIAHRELASQPLLLLMLALYDADGNALQRLPRELRQSDLYEQLLWRFTRREILKHGAGLPDRELDEAIEHELSRLSIVAFAMLNRGSQWVTEADLDRDMIAIFGTRQARAGQEMRAPLRAAEIMLGHFFFIHRSQARRDDVRLETYEFLHSTFGEFLVARFIMHMLADIAARAAASKMMLASAPPDDDLLHALTSFSVLSVRPSILSFLSEMTSQLSKMNLTAWSTLLKQLLRAASASRPARHFDEYRPVQLTMTARHAAYSANLVIFAVCAKGSIRASELFSIADPVEEWHRQALLWRSQVRTEEWISLVEIFALNRLRNGQTRDILIALDNGTFETPAISLDWTYGLPAADAETDWGTLAYANQGPRALSRKANFLCGVDDDVVNHALAPLLNTLGNTVNFVVQGSSAGLFMSPANAMIKAWLLPLQPSDPEERSAVYKLCAAIAAGAVPSPLDDQVRYRLAFLLLERIATDEAVPPSLIADILDMFADRFLDLLGAKITQTGLAFLGCDRTSDMRIADVLGYILTRDLKLIRTLTGLEAWVRLAELNLPFPGLLHDQPAAFLRSVAARRPDLADRAMRVIKRLQGETDI